MAFLLFILAMMSRVSSVFADDYLWKIKCSGGSHETRCEIPGMDVKEFKYYQLELIETYPHENDYQPCTPSFYHFEIYNNRPTIRVGWACNALFGIKVNYTGFPYDGKCGQNNYGYRIIKGTKAKECQFPWMVFVKLNWERYHHRVSCGGSIVNNKWILTAAHCIILQSGSGYLPPPEAMTVRTGTLYKHERYILRNIRTLIVHPDYTRIRLTNDIALMELDKPIKWDKCHAPVCLNQEKDVDKTTHLTCMVSGWGNQNPRYSDYAKTLMWAYDKILTRQKCNEIYRELSNEQTVCGRSNTQSYGGFCAGDSGGPLVCKHETDGRFYQHGVVSLNWADRPCMMEGLYSSVGGYYSWIKRIAFGG